MTQTKAGGDAWKALDDEAKQQRIEAHARVHRAAMKASTHAEIE